MGRDADKEGTSAKIFVGPAALLDESRCLVDGHRPSIPSVPDVESYRAWADERVRDVLDAGPEHRLIAMVVGSVDWRATVDGRSAGLSSPPDRALLRAWRGVADVLLVGSRTLEQERYGSIIPTIERDAREARGQTSVPRILTISRGMTLDLAQALRAEPELSLTIYSSTHAAEPTGYPAVEVVDLPDLDVAQVLADVRTRYRATTIVCEGGPTLLARLAERDLLTDISLTVAPLWVGSGPPLFETYNLDRPEAVNLVRTDVHEGSLFAHYALGWAK